MFESSLYALLLVKPRETTIRAGTREAGHEVRQCASALRAVRAWDKRWNGKVVL